MSFLYNETSGVFRWETMEALSGISLVCVAVIRSSRLHV